jgi:hypothetical protein
MKRTLLLGVMAVTWACGGGEDKPSAVRNRGPTGGSESFASGGLAGHAGGGLAGGAGHEAGSAGKSSGGTAGAGGKATGGSRTGGQGGAVGGAGGVTAIAPSVKITSPAHVTDPIEAGVLVGDAVDVLCDVTASTDPGARPVDPNTIRIQLTDALTTVTANNTVSTENPDKPGEYEATFVLTSTAHGAVSFTCSASDTSRPSVTGSDTVANFVDKGPVIAVTEPARDSFHALKDPLHLDFTVTPAPLADGDTGAQLGTVTVQVDGVAVKCDDSPTGSGHYLCDVDLTNPTYFSPPPAGEVPVNISAADVRQPTPAVSIYDSFIQIDGTPPTIAVTGPKSGSMIGGQAALVFTVKDPDSGVDPSTVAVTINRTTFYYDASQVQRWEANLATGTFTFYFDKRDLSDSVVQATIMIDASDKVGNSTNDGTGQRGASLVLYRDDRAPVVDLDPPTVRELRLSGATWYCSSSFDPLGNAASQGQLVHNVPYFRALVWDLTNQASADQQVFYHAGTNPSSVYLYLQDDVYAPFVINASGVDPADLVKHCDEIATPPAGTTEHKQQLSAIPATGTASYLAVDPDPDPPVGGYSLGTDKDLQPGVCAQHASSLSRVIGHEAVGHDAVVYGISPDASGLECTGRYWEIKSVIDRPVREGWLCLAARASDNLGNVRVSAPLIVCYDDDTTPYVPDCIDPNDPSHTTVLDPATVVPPITCTDGCTPVRFVDKVDRYINDLR